jgi:citrate synthase
VTRPTTETWKTAVTEVGDSVIRYRGRPIEGLLDDASIEDVILLVVFGREADAQVADAIRRALLAAADHGVAAPSIAVARITASTRGPIAAAIGAGLVAFGGPAHGGAAEASARHLQTIAAKVGGGTPVDVAVEEVVSAVLHAGQRVPGFGHPVHAVDPRTEPLLAAPLEDRTHRDLVRPMERRLQTLSPRLTANADVAVAALLLDAGLMAEDIGIVTAIGRTIGLAAHVREETVREAPFRAPSPSAVTYDGPDTS